MYVHLCQILTHLPLSHVVVVSGISVVDAQKSVKTSPQRQVRPPVVAQMPLAQNVGLVAQILHVLGEDLKLERQPRWLRWSDRRPLQPLIQKAVKYFDTK